ncbi:PucR family transcriptional regulator [Nocardioides anomalus]|uniref:PucR family transcriptional regulator n=1 Tax=Nocardioides anomalus TaxID=2712223 RepID=UPI001E5DD975|nr:PucR family transcriptional regulator [Nocardioides anomalus]
MTLSPAAVKEMRSQLPHLADDIVSAIVQEVPAYRDAFSGPMGQTISNAVRLALGGFLTLAGRSKASDQRTTALATEGSYQLGRGEARSGRSTDALLAAYRIGARVAWRELSSTGVRHGLGADVLADFAQLVFAYIDEQSAAAVAGHSEETETTGRVRQRLLDRLAELLLEGASADELTHAAERAGWPEPRTLTAVLAPTETVRAVVVGLPRETLQVPEADGDGLLLVPDVRRSGLLRTLRDHDALAGPTVAWREVRRSVDRAVRARALGVERDTESALPHLVLHADEDALADLRAQALAPLDALKPSARDKLADTLRAWLLHQGRRDDVAKALFVHPQTVRYRMGQLRDLYGDRLEDPDTVLALTLALA